MRAVTGPGGWDDREHEAGRPEVGWQSIEGQDPGGQAEWPPHGLAARRVDGALAICNVTAGLLGEVAADVPHLLREEPDIDHVQLLADLVDTCLALRRVRQTLAGGPTGSGREDRP